MTSTIAVEDLRIGMYVQLDGGWLSHPFALSAFRIATAEQIGTLRGLGLRQVRWVPEKSELPPDAVVPRSARAATGDVAAAARGGEGDKVDEAEEADEAEMRRQSLAAQRAAVKRCERQHGEAAKAWREASDDVAADPQKAGRSTEALAQAMVDKMLDADDIAIRLVGGGGDRMAAHAINVAVISMLIGQRIGLSPDEMLALGSGALMHDVGKQDVQDRFRHAEEGFSSAELNTYRSHVAKGVLLGQRMGLSPDALLVLAQHHEHADGSGFPQRLQADRLSMAARIVAIVNRYDNLCNPASRALALTPHEAVAMLFAHGRSRYDATVLNAFIRMMGVYPAGSLVQLTDDRYAMVIGVSSTRPLKPCVLVHDARLSRHEAQLLDLESVADLGIRRSLPATKLPSATLQVLDPRPRVSYYFEPLARERPPEHAQEWAA